MDRRCGNPEEWDDLHDALMTMESEALSTIREFAPKEKVVKS